MRTNVSETSREAFSGLQRDRKLQPMQTKVLVALRSGKAFSRKQICKLTGMELSSVCGRVNSLIAAGLLELHGEAVDLKTGKAQALVRITMSQHSLFA
jgi:hypothetical protein